MKGLVVNLLFLFAVAGTSEIYAQITGTITVHGDFDKFYPVTWYDGQWFNSRPTELSIGRSDVHTDTDWRGSLMSTITYHTTNYGHGASFINAFINYSVTPFIAGWRDVTWNNNDYRIIVWLRGGGTTYHYASDVNVYPEVHDGVQNSLPYIEENGPSHSFKTSVDPYVNSKGISTSESVDVYYSGNVGIGTNAPDERLTVKGKIHTQEVRVDLQGAVAPDYVFENEYPLTSLDSLASYIKQNKHLPEVPSAKEMEEKGLNLKEMNLLLLKKVEELTLYVIELKKENAQIEELKNRVEILERKN